MDWRMNSLWSEITARWTSFRSRLIRFISRLMAAATATVLAPLCF
jgi:hypothetical protein